MGVNGWSSVVDDGFLGVGIGVGVHTCENVGRMSGKIQIEKSILDKNWWMNEMLERQHDQA